MIEVVTLTSEVCKTASFASDFSSGVAVTSTLEPVFTGSSEIALAAALDSVLELEPE